MGLGSWRGWVDGASIEPDFAETDAAETGAAAARRTSRPGRLWSRKSDHFTELLYLPAPLV